MKTGHLSTRAATMLFALITCFLPAGTLRAEVEGEWISGADRESGNYSPPGSFNAVAETSQKMQAICREGVDGDFSGQVINGRVWPDQACKIIEMNEWHGVGNPAANYQTLADGDYAWEPFDGSYENAVRGGTGNNGNELFICRATADDGLKVAGKLVKAIEKCVYLWNHGTIYKAEEGFEILNGQP